MAILNHTSHSELEIKIFECDNVCTTMKIRSQWWKINSAIIRIMAYSSDIQVYMWFLPLTKKHRDLLLAHF